MNVLDLSLRDGFEEKNVSSSSDNSSGNDLFREDFSDGGGEGFGLPLEKHNDLLNSLTDFDDFLKIMVSEWLGLFWNESKEKYVRSEGVEPVMNVQGAKWCINFLRIYARKNNIITRIGRNEYNNIISDVIEVAYLNIGTRSESFGIKNDGDILLVCTQLIHSTELVLMGAGGSKTYNDLLMGTVNYSESGGGGAPVQSGAYPGKPPAGGLRKFWNVMTGKN